MALNIIAVVTCAEWPTPETPAQPRLQTSSIRDIRSAGGWRRRDTGVCKIRLTRAQGRGNGTQQRVPIIFVFSLVKNRTKTHLLAWGRTRFRFGGGCYRAVFAFSFRETIFIKIMDSAGLRADRLMNRTPIALDLAVTGLRGGTCNAHSVFLTMNRCGDIKLFVTACYGIL